MSYWHEHQSMWCVWVGGQNWVKLDISSWTLYKVNSISLDFCRSPWWHHQARKLHHYITRNRHLAKSKHSLDINSFRTLMFTHRGFFSEIARSGFSTQGPAEETPSWKIQQRVQWICEEAGKLKVHVNHVTVDTCMLLKWLAVKLMQILSFVCVAFVVILCLWFY